MSRNREITGLVMAGELPSPTLEKRHLMSAFRLVLIDTNTLDRALIRSYLSLRYESDLQIVHIGTSQELESFLKSGEPANAVVLGVLPENMLVQSAVTRLAAELPHAMLILVVGRYPDAATTAGVDPNRVALLPAQQLARLPYMLSEWEERKDREQRMLSETQQIPGASDDLYSAISSLTSDYVYITEVQPDLSFKVVYRSDALCEMIGYSHEEINATGIEVLVHPDDRDFFVSRRDDLFRGDPRIDEFRMLTRDGSELWIREYARPITRDGASVPAMIVGAAQDITNEKLLQSRLAVQASILEMIARGEPTHVVLAALNSVIEEQIPGAHCSVQKVDEATCTLYPDVATSLPPEFLDAIWTVPISPEHGACGSAAFYGAMAISVDAFDDSRFDRYQDVLSYFGLRAVWSAPIFNFDGNVSGTFALYFRSVREPRDHEIALLGSAAQIAGIAMDVDVRETERHLAQMYYQTLVEQTPAITFMSNPGDPCDITYLSPQFSKFSDVPAAEIMRNPERVRGFIHQDDRTGFDDTVKHSRATGEPLHIDFRIRRLNGTISWLEARVSLLRNHQGMPMHWLGVLLDVTDRNEAIQKMVDSERRYRSLFDDNLNSIVMYDYEGRVIDLNPATERMSGYSAEELLGKALLWMIDPEDRSWAERNFLQTRAGISSQFTTSIVNKTGERVELSVSQSPVIVDGEIIGVSSISEDITERHRLENQLLRQAYHDSLTDLPNRVHFDLTLTAAINGLDRSCELAILFIDLNNFKVINDSLGHDVGDRFLSTIGRLLREVVPESANVARFGGDEFTVLLPCEEDGVGAATAVAERIMTELATPVNVDGYALGSNVSIGIAHMMHETPCEPRELV
ncbi:MAG: PAS domain S-box protein, partial [Thermomicrobiaceae bacterium]